MKNWNTDTRKFTSKKDREIWELVQKIEYGFDGELVSRKEIRKHWDDIKYRISTENKRLFEFYLWGKQYSLPTNISFWNMPQKVV